MIGLYCSIQNTVLMAYKHNSTVHYPLVVKAKVSVRHIKHVGCRAAVVDALYSNKQGLCFG